MAMIRPPSDGVQGLQQVADDIDPRNVVRRFLKVATQIMKADIQENFKNSASPTMEKWAPLRFPRPEGGEKPLMNTGLLRASFTGGKEHIERVADSYAEVGSNRPGVNLQNFGGEVRPRKAKALAIPITKEAKRVRGPREFPRPLFMIWKKDAETGILAENVMERVGRKSQRKLKVHYILAKVTRHVARPMVGFGERVNKKLASAWARVTRAFFRGRPSEGGE